MTDRLDELDYYALLGVPRGSTTDDIRRAFHAFALSYHPDRHSQEDEGKRDRAGQIYRRGTEAYRVLCDPQRRRDYDLQLANGQIRLDPAKAPRPSAAPGRPSTLPPAATANKARPFFAKAQQALKAGDLKTARLNLKIALGHEPDNALLKSQLDDVERKLKG